MESEEMKNQEEKKEEKKEEQIPKKLYDLVAQVLSYVESVDKNKEQRPKNHK